MFDTDIKKVVDSFTNWKDSELSSIKEQADFVSTVYSSIPGSHNILNKIVEKVTEELSNELEE